MIAGETPLFGRGRLEFRGIFNCDAPAVPLSAWKFACPSGEQASRDLARAEEAAIGDGGPARWGRLPARLGHRGARGEVDRRITVGSRLTHRAPFFLSAGLVGQPSRLADRRLLAGPRAADGEIRQCVKSRERACVPRGTGGV